LLQIVVIDMIEVFSFLYHNGSQSQLLFWNRKYPSGWSDRVLSEPHANEMFGIFILDSKMQHSIYHRFQFH